MKITCCKRIDDIMLSDKLNRNYIIAAISARDLSKQLVRVKSSNVWAYGINTKDMKSKTGDVLVQFKGRNGGPGDIYMYFDVPVNIYRNWLGASSKGSYFWKYIRGRYMYRKLTGDKKTKMQGGI